jgi:hypothetical protein
MTSVNVDNLEPGMVLADDVRDSKGRLLLAKGATIASKHLLIFRTWGIVAAAIEGGEDLPADPLPAGISQAEMEQARDFLLSAYRHVDLNQPVMAELLRLASLRKVRNDRQQK